MSFLFVCLVRSRLLYRSYHGPSGCQHVPAPGECVQKPPHCPRSSDLRLNRRSLLLFESAKSRRLYVEFPYGAVHLPAVVPKKYRLP